MPTFPSKTEQSATSNNDTNQTSIFANPFNMKQEKKKEDIMYSNPFDSNPVVKKTQIKFEANKKEINK
jgi:hypothetical protein